MEQVRENIKVVVMVGIAITIAIADTVINLINLILEQCEKKIKQRHILEPTEEKAVVLTVGL